MRTIPPTAPPRLIAVQEQFEETKRRIHGITGRQKLAPSGVGIFKVETLKARNFASGGGTFCDAEDTLLKSSGNAKRIVRRRCLMKRSASVRSNFVLKDPKAAIF